MDSPGSVESGAGQLYHANPPQNYKMWGSRGCRGTRSAIFSGFSLEECFRVHGRTTWYNHIEEIQAGLDRFLAYYNLQPSHQDYRPKGESSTQALRQTLATDDLPDLTYSQPTEEDPIDEGAA